MNPEPGAYPGPDPIDEPPPADRFCDLVLNGGVASGVVYPWALIELARHFRFRNIGGNSVGAIAGALAAAAEYGRCTGVETAFEPLRRAPSQLAEEIDGRSLMQRLFQPAPALRRLFDAFVAWVKVDNGPEPVGWLQRWRAWLGPYQLGAPAALLLSIWLAACVVLACRLEPEPGKWIAFLALALLGLLGVALALALLLLWRGWQDLRALANNGFGLCPGKRQPGSGQEALIEWLHRGIQRSAGRRLDDAPLTFADLWHAPRAGWAPPAPPDGSMPADATVNLQVFTSNITLGRPVRLPLDDVNLRLFFKRSEWSHIFPESVLAPLCRIAKPYVPKSASDPLLGPGEAAELLELPRGDLPIVVAARLSLSFPLLFSCVPVHAIDYEAPRVQRRVRRCLLSDGGLCSNFPIHLFDAAHPRWPTFGLLLSRRLKSFDRQPVWLPEFHESGRGDNWQRGVPGVEEPSKAGMLEKLLQLMLGMAVTATDWNDRMEGRLPHVRNRVVRLCLRRGEGQLNIAMPGEVQLRMAQEYGSEAGKRLVERFVDDHGDVTRAWRDHLFVRTQLELRALAQHLRGYTRATQWMGGGGLPVAALLKEAQLDKKAPGGPLSADQVAALQRAVDAVQLLEKVLVDCEASFGSYRGLPQPELRLRTPI